MKIELGLSALTVVLAITACGGDDSPPDETVPVHANGGEGSPIDGAYAGASGDSGGATGSGGTSAAGGGGTVRKLVYGKHGDFPSTVTEADAKAAYQTWKDSVLEDCAKAGMRVKADEPSETLAEDVGYGALLSASWGDRKTFDGLWKYYQAAALTSDSAKPAKTGLMGWRVTPDACSVDQVDPGAPGQSALDMAMALLIADCQWPDGGYLMSSQRLITSIKNHLTVKVGSGTVLMTADDEDPGCMRPGYFAPGHYRVFAKVAGADSAFWAGMADDAYVFLNAAANPTTGLVPEWAANEPGSCGGADDFVGYDAIRATWRVATDYGWFGTSAAQAFLDKQIAWFDAEVGAAKLADLNSGFSTDGSELVGGPGSGDSGYVGAVASGTIAVSQKLSDAYFDVLLNKVGANDDGVRNITGRALYLMLGANKLSSACY